MIRLSKSVVGEQEQRAVLAVLQAGYLGMGTEVQKFENEIRDYLGGEVEVACVSTGTAAVQMALEGAGIGAGDEVLVPTLTFVATFQAISASGAKPIACENRLEDALIDLQDAEKRITKNTKAIMPVHYASNMGDYEAVYEFAKKHNLRVIEDAAHAFGCWHGDKKIGSIGDIVCFSFDGIKNITSGEGGAVVSKDKKVMAHIRDARLLGVEKDTEKRYSGQRSWEFDVTEQGWRYHMSNIMAAIGRVQLSRLESEFKPKRMRMSALYRKMLSEVGGVKLLDIAEGPIVQHIMPIRILNGRRDEVRTALIESGAEAGIHYKPNHLLTKFKAGPFPKAEQLYEELLTLPLHPEISENDVENVVSVVRKVVSR